MRTILAIALVLATACKARDHADAGLLDADAAAAKAATSAYDVSCVSLESEAKTLAYELTVLDVPLAGDETQIITVELAKVQAGAKTVLNVDDTATGVVSETGPLSVAFTGGVLSAETATADKAHFGVLTVFGDPDADALDVRCLVALRDPRG